MIQFYHFHNSARRYVDLIGEKNPEAAEGYLSVMHALSNFKRSKGSCFVYLPLKGKAYFLQTNSAGDEFAHGLIGEISELKYEPSRYVGALESKFNEPSETEVRDRPLPSAPDFQLGATRKVHPKIAEIVDALLYTKKLVVVTGQDPADLAACVKTVFKVLPLAFAVNVGFAVAPSRMPDIFDERMSEFVGNLRLIATTAECYASEELEVISLEEAPREGALRPYARVLRQFGNDLSSNRLTGFVAGVRACFRTDGTFDEKGVAKAAAIKLFEVAPTYESAMELLGSAKELGIEPDDAVDVIDFLLHGTTVTEEALKAIDEARTNDEIKRRTSDMYGRFLVDGALAGHALSAPQRECVFTYLANRAEEAPEEIEEKFASAPKSKGVFSLLVGAYAIGESDELLRMIMRYTDIEQTFNVHIGEDKKTKTSVDIFSEELFAVIDAEEAQIAEALFAAVLRTCYQTDATRNQYRFEAFKRYTNRKYPEIKARIVFLLAVKREVGACMRMTGGVDFVEDFDFLPKAWLSSLTSKKSLSFVDCLHLVIDPQYKIDGYAELRRQLISRLENLEEVRANVSHENLFAEYSGFLHDYKSMLVAPGELEAYLVSLQQRGDAFAEFARYRCDYVLKSYQTMSWSGKTEDVLRRVHRELPEYTVKRGDDQLEKALADPHANADHRQFIAEKVIDVLAGNCRVEKSDRSTNNGWYFLLAFLLSLAYMAVAAAILIVPQAAFAIVLGEDVVARILLNLKIYHVVAILCMGVLHFFAYAICWRSSNHNRKESIARASVLTLCYGVLPVLALEITFLVLYLI